jgi:LacI family transcriptional regulator
MPSVTLSDVARRAGVSPATASRAMNGQRHVSSGARERVAAAMRELDFVPNPAARGLSRARTSTIALLVRHSQYPGSGEGTFGTRVLLGASRALRARGYALLYAAADDADAVHLPNLPAAHPGRSDGLLLLGPAFPPAAIASLTAARRPLVLIDNRLQGMDAVLADNTNGTRRLTAHLVRHHRYRRVALLAGPARWPSTEERLAGYQQAIAAAGLVGHVIHAHETTVRDGATAFDALLAGGAQWDAVVAVNDAMAIGAMHRARLIPQAVRPAVAGFDDSAWASLADPPLTTVAVDAAAMGTLAAHRLIDRIEGQILDETDGWLARQPARLRVRRSCGCPVNQRVAPLEPVEEG